MRQRKKRMLLQINNWINHRLFGSKYLNVIKIKIRAINNERNTEATYYHF